MVKLVNTRDLKSLGFGLAGSSPAARTITPGAADASEPRPENGYNERFNETLRRQVLKTEWFTTTRQAPIVINQWLRQ